MSVMFVWIRETEKAQALPTELKAEFCETRLRANFAGGGRHLHTIRLSEWDDFRRHAEGRIGRVVRQVRKVPMAIFMRQR